MCSFQASKKEPPRVINKPLAQTLATSANRISWSTPQRIRPPTSAWMCPLHRRLRHLPTASLGPRLKGYDHPHLRGCAPCTDACNICQPHLLVHAPEDTTAHVCVDVPLAQSLTTSANRIYLSMSINKQSANCSIVNSSHSFSTS